MFKSEERDLHRNYHATAEHHSALGFFPPAEKSVLHGSVRHPVLSVIAQIATFVWVLPRNIAIGLMQLYRKAISPLYGDVCKFYPTCSAYALQSIHKRGLLTGIILGSWRIIRCNPWADGGLDKAREATHDHYRSTKHGFVFLNPDAINTKRGNNNSLKESFTTND